MYTLNCNGRLLVMDQPWVMGIINATPDSFYKASRKQHADEILRLAEKMITEGANIVDIGGQSTRPGSERISVQEETDRTAPAIERIMQQFPDAVISIDTYSSDVAKAAVQAGASIINDISSGDMDEAMLPAVAALQAPYICMHMQGTPRTMQTDPQYENVSVTVLDYLAGKVDQCRKAGIHDIIIDPGFGFGKTIAHNFSLLKSLPALQIIQRPLMVGLSRKSTIYKTLHTTAEAALNGTTVLHTIALMNGANILRVHDVKEAKEAIALFMVYKRV
ncbi:dihydropteroate synthase [Agriterribacter sp.]|uniref:dihydropteroate synthase n=1 Tax=Agriterribacter sp. TaxID=2821509 RepID=UPI002CF16016|nr:dihydropteroate synthase [Agriterribacter sp.]HRO46964.1 dihydropteroate synthase [Agriterribacter sp.]HRQ19588.1 dihydropteroate synthase [Agriterribacter sp.]